MKTYNFNLNKNRISDFHISDFSYSTSIVYSCTCCHQQTFKVK